MISESNYLKAKEIVDEYENQQKIEIERFESGDLNLLTILSVRPKKVLIEYNECSRTEEGDELIYISDVVRAIKKDGTTFNKKGKIYYWPIFRLRNLGCKSHDEIMEHVAPFL